VAELSDTLRQAAASSLPADGTPPQVANGWWEINLTDP
jgi:hypothetical protein